MINRYLINTSEINEKLSELNESNLISIDIYDKEQAFSYYGEIAKDGAILIDYYIDDLMNPKYYTNDLCSCDPSEYLCRCPLIVLDGVPLLGSNIKNVLNNLSPDEIKSITVIKDQNSAMAIYGERGINDVILIETNK